MTQAVQIVVLDGYTVTHSGAQKAVDTIAVKPTADDLQTGGRNTGDRLDWRSLAELGQLTVYDRSTPGQVLDRAAGASMVLVNKVQMTQQVMASLPRLRYIGVLATGVNNVDLDAATQRGVTVTNVPGYGSDGVAQHVFALLLELINHTSAHARAARDGTWSCSCDFSLNVAPIMELAGKTLGIVGVGAIGTRVARIGAAMGMNVMAAYQSSRARVHIEGVEIDWQPLEEMLAEADVVTLHCPLTIETHHLINMQRLTVMKPSAILINTGRGPLIDEPALADALNHGLIGAAGLDVLSVEPPPSDHPLLTAKNCVVTPHVAWASIEARRRMMDQVVRNVKAFLDGRPVNVVA